MENKNTGFGRVAPADAPEFAECTLTVHNGAVESAAFTCSENETLRLCAQTLCGAICGFPAADLMQMNNNVISYNMEKELARGELYLASMCVLAAKRAAADWLRKNGLPVPGDACCCD